MLLAVLGLRSIHAVSVEPVVHTPQGSLRGEILGGGVEAWRGVRYAKPPVGALRFAPAQPIVPWTGVLNATAFGNACVQPLPIPDAAGPGIGEDCLFLNVFRPRGAAGRGLPVTVWLHGGDLIWGAGSTRWFDGEQFVRFRDRILVTLNYRLGPLGFLPTDAAVRQGHGTGGLNGMLDQIAALEWVRDNIGSFGGNSSNVVLHGESSGGQSACVLMASPAAAGLFARVVLQSGPCIGGWAPNNASTGRHVTRQMLDAMGRGGISGCPRQPVAPAAALHNQSVLLAYMRAAPLACAGYWPDNTMFTADKVLTNYFFEDGLVVPFSSSATGSLEARLLSGAVWALHPHTAIDSLLIGANSRDGTTPFDYEPLPPLLLPLNEANELHWGAKLGPVVTKQYPASLFHGSKSTAFVTADSDCFVTCPSRRLAAAVTKAGVPVYFYEYAHLSSVPNCDVCVDPGAGVGPGAVPKGDRTWASHGSEVRFVFNSTTGPDDMNASITNICPFSAEEQQLVRAMDHFFGNFIEHGSPNSIAEHSGTQFPRWPQFKAKNSSMILSSPTLHVVRQNRQADCDFWDAIDDPAVRPH